MLGDGALGLDDMLGGGLRCGALHEIVASHRQDDGAASAFALALAIRCVGDQPLVWIVEDCAAYETGVPYRPGLEAHGLDPDRLVLVRTREAQTTLWAFEEALRLEAPVVLAEVWSGKHYDLAASRRLLLAAQAGRGTALLLHTGLVGPGRRTFQRCRDAAVRRLGTEPADRLGRPPHADPRRGSLRGADPEAASRSRDALRQRPYPRPRLEPQAKVLR